MQNIIPREKKTLKVRFGNTFCQEDKARCCNGTRRWQLSTPVQPQRSAAAGVAVHATSVQGGHDEKGNIGSCTKHSNLRR